MDLPRLIVESDSLVLVSLLQGSCTSLKEEGVLLDEIWNLKSHFQQVIFHHVRCENNVPAHRLAGAGINSSPILWLSNFPEWLLRVIKKDTVLGICSLRGISIC